MAESSFEEWGILDLFGHTRLAGKVTEVTLAGGAFLRIDVPGDEDGKWEVTQFYGTGAIFSLTITTEATAKAFAKHYRPQPATRWELSLPVGTSDDREY